MRPARAMASKPAIRCGWRSRAWVGVISQHSSRRFYSHCHVETSLSDNGSYYINAQDGFIALTVTNGGGKFDIHHDDARVTTEGDFQTIDESENRTRLVLAKGNAKVDIKADDGRIRLVKR